MAMRDDHDSQEDLVRLYLNEIGRHQLLTKADEQELGRAIEEAREAAEELRVADEPRGRNRRAIPIRRRRELQTAVRKGDSATRQFVQSNLRLVVSIAKRYQATGLPLLDLIQEGNLGLMHAVEKFDYKKGFKFSTYATWWIRQSITRGVANTARTIRLPVHADDLVAAVQKAQTRLHMELARPPTVAEVAVELHMKPEQVSQALQLASEPVSISEPRGEDGDAELGDILADRTALSPVDEATAAALPAEVARMLAVLEDREREILRMRFGLDRGEPRTLEEVGERLNLSQERIRQIESRAMSKLRHPSVDTGAYELLVG